MPAHDLGEHPYRFDPSGTAIRVGLVRLGTGRDVADVAIGTLFGTVRPEAPRIALEAVADDATAKDLVAASLGTRTGIWPLNSAPT